MAKLFGTLTGLELAWRLGYRKIFLESDSRQAMDLVKQGCHMSHPFAFMVGQIHSLIEFDWEIITLNIRRDQNHIADWLASLAHDSVDGFQFFLLFLMGAGTYFSMT